jgi:DNA-binding NarL/FixJ family response regulator
VEKKKSVLLVDDHPLFREGVKSLIARSAHFEVVGEADNAAGGLSRAVSLRPDLVVMDLSLPDGSGIDVTRDISSRLPTTRVLIMSMHSKIDHITKAFQAGARGYVVKQSAADRRIQALEAVSKDEYFLDTSLSRNVVENLIKLPENEAKITDAGYETLTSREQQVMRLLAEGLSSKDVAEKLFISPKTVENHRANIMSKLDVHSTMELVRYAAKLGLIDVDLWRG